MYCSLVFCMFGVEWECKLAATAGPVEKMFLKETANLIETQSMLMIIFNQA